MNTGLLHIFEGLEATEEVRLMLLKIKHQDGR